jgi:hypothetical protein
VINRLRQARRIATSHEKRVINDLAKFHMAMILQRQRSRIQWFRQVLLADPVNLDQFAPGNAIEY